MWSSNAYLPRHLCSLILVGDAFRPFKVLSGGLKKKRAREEEAKGDGSQAGEDVEDGDKKQDQGGSVLLVSPAVVLLDSWPLWSLQQIAPPVI